MKASRAFISTLREVPSEAEIISHQLMLKAGYIRKVASGIYTYMPLAMRSIQKIINIIREEMNFAGGQEIILPIIQPAELWQESNRWEVYGEEMFRLSDRHGRDFCLGPTHEEIVTDLVRREVNSYKELPLLLYQIQNKYRDEKRPRFGLIRCREFIMKDLYSFDKTEDDMKETYNIMLEAYKNIFTRCGLTYKIVEADTGAIGGNISHEFMVIAETGESEIVYCENCNYAANIEKAEAVPQISYTMEPYNIDEVYTPEVNTIEKLSQFLNIEKEKIIKSLFYKADENIVCVLLRGDRELNEVKLKNSLNCIYLNMASEEDVKSVVNCEIGYVGPVGLKGIKILADKEVPYISNAVTGANKDKYHLKNVNPKRDFCIDSLEDLRIADKDDACIKCKSKLQKAKGIEVGQLFQLGTKYSDVLNAGYTEKNGNVNKIYMGCYGIGVGRTLAAAVEQNNDENGIINPLSISPYHVILIPISDKDEVQMRFAKEIYDKLNKEKIEVLFDDRDYRAGVKLNDADLIGIPLKIVVGKKTVENGTVDLVRRDLKSEEKVSVADIVDAVKEIISTNN